MSLQRAARVPPQSLEAEQATLGAMLLERAAIEKACELLQPEDFYREAHRIIFQAAVDLSDRSEPVDLTTLAAELENRGQLEQAGGRPYLAALLDAVPTAAHVEYYARIVEQKAILRRLITVGTEVVETCFGEVENIEDVVDRAESAILSVAQRRTGRAFTPLKPLLDEAMDSIERLYRDKVETTGVPSGLRALDEMTNGFQKSDLIIVAARPSMGKTSLCINIGVHAAVHAKVPVAIFSLEMSKEQLAMRIIQSEARVDSRRLRTGHLNEEQWRRMTEGVNRVWHAPIYIDDTPGISAMEMRGKARRLRAEVGPLGLVIVDYLQLMRWHGRVESRQQEISEIARSLKNLARELEVPVIALSQLSRAVERREDKRPILSDLRESGSIEAEADLVMMLYRPSYYQYDREEDAEDVEQAGAERVDETQLIIAKHRNGPTGTVDLIFMPDYARFGDQADAGYY
ncbi:MAG TPA: replicative DNA helicase [Armatimonadota bacterium]|nr:replicative DNA helicase [Armatimonadota bacterium]HOJ21035.1 replicative DNA helicase [Armatimonadota bacterium]HOM80941.1 replicative DNA helicase [Armatimonadota bacterium]HPO72746.1 replicative DNA helicase [Armatimonadota bacterium]HPT96999.1 replicative DNA helicase [Armatimonadota bacterium]